MWNIFIRYNFTEVDFLPSTVTDRPDVLDSTSGTNIDLNSNEISDDIDNSNLQPGCSRINRSFKSPKNFLPPLKAEPRNNKRKPRKLGKSMIATDTPKKDEIAEERMKTLKRKSKAKQIKRQILTYKESSINKKKKTKKIETDSESSENDVVLNSSSSDLEWFEKDTNDYDDENANTNLEL